MHHDYPTRYRQEAYFVDHAWCAKCGFSPCANEEFHHVPQDFIGKLTEQWPDPAPFEMEDYG